MLECLKRKLEPASERLQHMYIPLMMLGNPGSFYSSKFLRTYTCACKYWSGLHVHVNTGRATCTCKYWLGLHVHVNTGGGYMYM